MQQGNDVVNEVTGILRRLSELVPALSRDAELGRQVRGIAQVAPVSTRDEIATKGTRAKRRGRTRARATTPGLISVDGTKLLDVLNTPKWRRGGRLGELARELKWTTTKIRYQLDQLRELGAVEVRGTRGQARWFARTH